MITTEPLDLEPIKARTNKIVPGRFRPLVEASRDLRTLLAEVEHLRNTEPWDEVERLRGQVERLELEKHDLIERLIATGGDPS
jgi:hypothetical protein